MFAKYFRKNKPNIYLDQLAVVPQEDWHRIGGNDLFRKENLESELQNLLQETFALQPLHDRQSISSNDLVMDIFVSKYTSGEFDVAMGDFGVPLLWRPAIELKARVTVISTGKVITIQKVKVKASWATYCSKVFSFRGFFRSAPLFQSKDLEPLFHEAAYKILLRIKRAAKL